MRAVIRRLARKLCTSHLHRIDVTSDTEGAEVFSKFWAARAERTLVGAVTRRLRTTSARSMDRMRPSALGALADSGGEFLDVIEDLATFGHLAANLLLGIHHRGVIAAERLADLGQRQIGELAAEVHRDLAGLSQGPRLARPPQLLDGGLEVLGGRGHDRRRADLHGA